MLAPSRTNVSSLSSSSSSAYDNVAVYSHLEAISNQRGTVSTFQRGQASDAGDMRRAGNVVSRGGVYVGSGGAGGTVGGGPSGPSGLVGGPSTGTGGGLGGMNLGPGGVGGGPGGTAGGTGGGGEFQDAGDEDEDGIMCLARCPACERCIAWCDNRSEGAKPFNLHTKFICLLLIIYAGFVTATARGLFAILQGVLGIIFAIEGLWNSARYYPAGIRKFIGFLVLYVLCSAGIGIMHVNTVSFYCESAESLKERDDCEVTTTLNSWLTFIGALVIIPIIIVVFIVYYRTVLRYLRRLESRADGQKKIAMLKTSMYL